MLENTLHKLHTMLDTAGAALIVYLASISTYETKQGVGVLFGSYLQYTYLKHKNWRIFILILSSSIFLAFFIIDPLMSYYRIEAESFLRLPIISSSGFISTILLSSGLYWLPNQVKAKVNDMLGLSDENTNNNDYADNYPDSEEERIPDIRDRREAYDEKNSK